MRGPYPGVTGDGEAAFWIAAALSGHAPGVSRAPQRCLRAAVIVAVAGRTVARPREFGPVAVRASTALLNGSEE